MTDNKRIKVSINDVPKVKIKKQSRKKIKVHETTSNLNDVAVHDGGEF